MTSLFDPVPPRGSVIPLNLIHAGGRDVSLLEFIAADAPVEEVTAMPALNLRAECESAEAQRASQVAVMIDAAREAAGVDMRRSLEGVHAAALAAQMQRITRAAAEFENERRRYFAQAEAEVVRLALAVAAKILQREAEADATYLRATVQAALSRVQDGSACTLRVASCDVEAWLQELAREPEERLTLEEDRALERGDCRLETAIGTVELGAVTQLTEVARTFRERRGC